MRPRRNGQFSCGHPYEVGNITSTDGGRGARCRVCYNAYMQAYMTARRRAVGNRAGCNDDRPDANCPLRDLPG